MKKIIVFTALPYSNNALHLGHILEYIQADIWVRYLRMQGHQVHFIGGDDNHGTPIMLRAKKLNITPEELIAGARQSNLKDYQSYQINYDHYRMTHSPENEQLCLEVFTKLQQQGLIEVKKISQLFDPQEEMFLADRYVTGSCPKCNAEDQNGDSCEKCGSTYNAVDLINPKSSLSGETPVLKDTNHFFFKLPKLQQDLEEWNKKLPASLANKMQEWFSEGLKDWDISRDKPYFGFAIPDSDQYFYVWLDAPLGYLSTFKHYCQTKGLDFDEFWKEDSETEVYNFLGKDILYFHALFWPALLQGINLRKPNDLMVHGYVTVNGEKMSKSRGTFIKASTFIKHCDATSLRYYYASKLRRKIVDIDINFEDFVLKVNSDLVNKLVNLASRTAKFINKYFASKLADQLLIAEDYNKFKDSYSKIADDYQELEFAGAIREIMSLADLANKFIDEQAPWSLAKDSSQLEANSELHKIVTQGIIYFRDLIILLSPVVPELATKTQQLFKQVEEFKWSDLEVDLLGQEITQFTPLYQRIDSKQIAAIIEDTKADLEQEKSIDQDPNQATIAIEEIAEPITIDDFAKVDLRIAKVLKCELVESSDKLLKFTLKTGELEDRVIFSGIRDAYPNPELLNGRNVVFVANLKPRKMRFGISNGMILSAQDAVSGNFLLLDCDQSLVPGSKIS